MAKTKKTTKKATSKKDADKKTTAKKTPKKASTGAKKTTANVKKTTKKASAGVKSVKGAPAKSSGAASLLQKPKTLKKILIGVAIFVAVVALIVISPPFRFEQAMNAFRGGDYTSAQEKFAGLGNYKEAEAWAKDSATMVEVMKDVEAKEFRDAIKKLDDLTVAKDMMNMLKNIVRAERCLNDGTEAIEDENEAVSTYNYKHAFFYLYLAETNQEEDTDAIRFSSADEEKASVEYDEQKVDEYKATAHASKNAKISALADEAEKGLAYAEAEDLFQNGKYDEAKAKFAELGDYMDAAQRVEKCDSTKAEKQSAYDEAKKLFDEKKFYQALKKYQEARPYLDAKDRAEDCYQETPETGSLKTSAGSGATLTAKAPKGMRNFFLKFYQGDKAVGTVFVRSGESADISLPAGKTQIRMATGTQWFGENDLFGENGMYTVLSGPNDDKNFTLLNGVQYNLTLGGASKGNVGATQVEQENF